MATTIGQYIAARFKALGLQHYFAMPGDYNLALLEQLLLTPELKMINCCNELNAGYAADGYSRATGISALVVTYSVGGLSAINAVAGAYAENIPMIVISGSPSAIATIQQESLHHTLGKVDYEYVRAMFKEVTAAAYTIVSPTQAPQIIDEAILTALQTKKPVYIEIPCNMQTATICDPMPLNFKLDEMASDEQSLAAAVTAAAAMLNKAEKPVLISGIKLRAWKAISQFQQLAKASGYGVAAMPSAKNIFPEQDPQYVGIYWGTASSQGCAEVVESADCYLSVGMQYTDYSTAGYTTALAEAKHIKVDVNSVTIAGTAYHQINMADFLTQLTKQIKFNDHSIKTYRTIRSTLVAPAWQEDAQITIRQAFEKVNPILTSDYSLIVDVGTSWFDGINLKLPENCEYFFQMQYGSIGWSVGATLGYSVATQNKKRVIAFIGDGAFQMGAQELSTIIRYNTNPIIFLLNNGCLTIEAEITDGPFNTVRAWDYQALVKSFNATDGKAWSAQVTTGAEFSAALATAVKHTEGPSIIEVKLDRNDCNRLLLEWGVRVAEHNSKPFLITLLK